MSGGEGLISTHTHTGMQGMVVRHARFNEGGRDLVDSERVINPYPYSERVIKRSSTHVRAKVRVRVGVRFRARGRTPHGTGHD